MMTAMSATLKGSEMFKDVFPYRDVIADSKKTMPNGRTFRYIAYGKVAGRPSEPQGAAVFDEDRKIVLVDRLYTDAASPEQLAKHLDCLLGCGMADLATVINAHPEARFQLSADGNIAW